MTTHCSPRSRRSPLFAQRSYHQYNSFIKKEDFSVVAYNTLSDAALLRSQAYEYCKKEFKDRITGSQYRHQLLMKELEWLDGSILSLQEIDPSYFDNLLHPSLSKLGYDGHLVVNSEEGNATFYKTDMFELVMKKEVSIFDRIQEVCKESNQDALIDHLKVPSHVLMTALRHKSSNKLIIIGNVHIDFDWYGHSVRQLLTISSASKILHEFKESLKPGDQHLDIAHIFCGDFNIEPQYPAYKVLSTGRLDKDDLETMETTDYIKYYENIWRSPPTRKISEKEKATLCHLNKYFVNSLKTVKSTYKTVLGREPEVTNHEGGKNHWVLDYLWYSSDSLYPTGVLDVVPLSLVDSVVGLPNEFFPSDHLSLKASYCFIH